MVYSLLSCWWLPDSVNAAVLSFHMTQKSEGNWERVTSARARRWHGCVHTGEQCCVCLHVRVFVDVEMGSSIRGVRISDSRLVVGSEDGSEAFCSRMNKTWRAGGSVSLLLWCNMENISEAIKGRKRLRYRNLWSQQVKGTIRGSSVLLNEWLSPVWMRFYHSCSKKTDFPRPSSGVLPWIYFLFAQILNFSLWNLKRLFLWLERSSKEKLLCDLREFSKVSGTVFMESLQTSPTLRMPQTDFFFL